LVTIGKLYIKGRKMYGTRVKIGLIVPSINDAIEPEFNALQLKNISIHSTRVLLTSGTIEGEKEMLEGIEPAVKLIAGAGVSLIVFACTTGSLINGKGWDRELIQTIEKLSGIPATTTSTALLKVLSTFNITKVALALPYPEELNQLEKKFLETEGIKVVCMKGLGMTNVQEVSLDTIYQLALEVDTPQAEAVFISCTGLKTLPIIEKLEKKLDKLVFSSNTATFWDAMKILKVNQPIRGYGSLLANKEYIIKAGPL
jgi:maleate isomerase